MARKVGLSLDDVVDAAARLADDAGLEAVTLASVAAGLGVRAPSLYAHVEGLDGLRRQLARRAAQQLGDTLATALAGVEGDDPAEALTAVAHAYRHFAHTHRGLYAALLPAPDPDLDPEAADDFASAIAAPAAVMARFELSDDTAIDAVRTLRSLLHGFVDLELRGGFGLPQSIDASFDAALDLMVASLRGATHRLDTAR